MTDDGPVMTSATISGDDLRPEHLRLPLMSVLRGAFATAALGPRGKDSKAGFSRREGIPLKVPVGSGRPIDPTSARQRLDEVAAIFKKTPRGKTGQAVADHFNIHVSYARSLISEARKAGLIE